MQDDRTKLKQPINHRTTRIELDNGICLSIDDANLPVRIGRDSSCDIRIPSGHVSRHHCELFLQNGVLCLRDTSSNGTTVDNQLVKQASVSINQRTRVLLADEVKIILTPVEVESIAPVTPGKAIPEDVRPARARATGGEGERRRSSDRRSGEDRRKRNVLVSFERRSGAPDRRHGPRRRDYDDTRG